QTPNKRRLYTEQEDIMLLRQVNAERPFEAKKGEVMKVWGLVAIALADHEDFARPQFDTKKAHTDSLLQWTTMISICATRAATAVQKIVP
ncbi:hypothetical protein DYB28_016159, partial [Aphanomyces astaci]